MLSVTRMTEDLRKLREDNVRLAAEYKQVHEYNSEIVSENQRLKTKLNMFREAFSVVVDECAALGVKTPSFLVRLLDRLRPLINNA